MPVLKTVLLAHKIKKTTVVAVTMMKTVKIRLRVVRMMTRTIVKLLMINNQLIQASMMSSGGIVNEQKRLYYQRNHYCSYCCAR